MKVWKKIRKGLLFVFTLTLLIGQTAFAAPYTYTVTIYAGNQGSFNSSSVQVSGASYQITGDAEKIQITGLQYGDIVSVNAQSGMVTLNDADKYYVRGVRESGYDNNTVGNSSFTVEGDRDYVVAYGIRGNMVSYVVNYQDTAGNLLAPSETYYGAVGDRPVVAHLYVENYQPQAYNLTRTLSADETANVFTFTYLYVPEATATVTTVTTTDTTTTAGTTAAGADAGTTAAGADAGAAAGADAGAAAGADAGAGTTTEGAAGEGTAETTPEGPAEIIDLDDEEVPLAEADTPEATTRPAGNMPIFIGIAAAAVACLATVFIVMRKRQNK